MLTHIAVQHSLARKRREKLERKQGLESTMQISMLCWRTSIMKVCASHHKQVVCLLDKCMCNATHACKRVCPRTHMHTRTARTRTYAYCLQLTLLTFPHTTLLLRSLLYFLCGIFAPFVGMQFLLLYCSLFLLPSSFSC